MLRQIRKLLKQTPWAPVDIGYYLRWRYLRRLVKLPSGGLVLDAGCGPGLSLVALARLFPDMRFVGCDSDLAWFHEVQTDPLPPNLSVRVVDLLAFDEGEVYDYILTQHTLEHIPGNRQALANLFRSLKPGGLIYIDLPHDKGHHRIFPRQWLREYHDLVASQHIGEQYSLPELTGLMEQIGFEVVYKTLCCGLVGRFALEADRLITPVLWLRALAMPLLKTLAILDFYLPKKKGDVIAIGRKPAT